MGLFNFLKNRKSDSNVVLKMINDHGNGFYSWNGNLYHSDLVRACIKPKTKAIGKIVAKHIRSTASEDGSKNVLINPSVSIKFLLEDPNEYMSGQMLQEKVTNQLALNGNAFILILRNQYGYPVGQYPIPCSGVEAIYDENGDLNLKFYLLNGKYMTVPYSDVIHLRDDFYNNDLFGESPQRALAQLMECVTITDQGLVNAVKNSAIIKWLLKFTSAVRDDDLKQRATEFADNYLSISNNAMGVAAINSNVEAQQIHPDNYVPNAAQSDRNADRIYAFFNTNAKIVHSNYTENEWISYYEANIEPLAMQMANEYTRKLFTRKERSFGNEIVFESSALTFASMSTKLNLVQFVDRGIMTPNEVRGYMNLAPLEGGDVALLRKDTGTLIVDGGTDDAEDD